MAESPWTIASNGTGKRHWFVVRNGVAAEDMSGRKRAFATAKAAELAAEKLNDAKGIFVSGFKGVADADAELVRERFLAGDTPAEVRGHFRDRDGKLLFSASKVRRMRDEVFAPLVGDAEAVKALATGPMLNPISVVRYRHPREEVAAAAAQINLFQA